jgi:hypothetical protein
MRFPRMFRFIVASTAGGIFLCVSATAGSVAASSCGQYMYWDNGKCLDARAKAPAHWTKRSLDKNFSSHYW